MSRTNVLAVVAMCMTVLGCQSPEEKCYDSRVEADGEWKALETQIAPACEALKGEPWKSIYAEGSEAMGKVTTGRGSRRDAVTASLALGVEEPRNSSMKACKALKGARSKVNGKAIAAHDSATNAIRLTRKLRDGAEDFRKKMEDYMDDLDSSVEWSAEELMEDINTYADTLANETTAKRIDAAEAASEEAWKSCKSVDP